MITNRPRWVQPEGTAPLSHRKRIPSEMAREWDYCHRLFKGKELLIETVHKSLTSLNMELDVSRRRIRRGEATDIECGPL